MNVPACLILHGFTSSLDTVRILKPRLEALGLPVSMPLLRGHGTRPEDLCGVRWQDWVEDARRELLALDRPTIVLGLSMGGLIALDLGVDHPDRVLGVVSIAPPIRLATPLVYLLPLIYLLVPWWSGEPHYADPALAARDTCYRRFPIPTFVQFHHYMHLVRKKLHRFERPLLLLQTTQDRTVRPRSAQIVFDMVASARKEIAWFSRSGHEMLLDVEREAVVERILAFVSTLPGVIQETGEAVNK